MRAYQCDRCGSFYDHSNRIGRDIYITSSSSATGFIKDLCDECQKELTTWWKLKKTEESEVQFVKEDQINEMPRWIGKRCDDCGNERCKSLGELPKGHDCALWQPESEE